jgi:hypothetical protein
VPSENTQPRSAFPRRPHRRHAVLSLSTLAAWPRGHLADMEEPPLASGLNARHINRVYRKHVGDEAANKMALRSFQLRVAGTCAPRSRLC